MIDHASREQIEGFCARTLDPPQLTAIGGHIACCDSCLQLFRETLRQKRNYAPVQISLSPDHWFKDDHLDYEQLVGFVDERMDDEEREIASIHLQSCARCHSDVRSFLEYRRESKPEMLVRYAPEEGRKTAGKLLDWWRWPWTHWKPVYAAAMLAVFGTAIIVTIFLWREKTGDQQMQRTVAQPADASPKPSVVASVSPTVVRSADDLNQSSTNRLPAPPNLGATDSQPQASKLGGPVALKGLSPEMQGAIKEALLVAEIKKPDALMELVGVRGPERGVADQKFGFRLLSPGGLVVLNDRPTFKWEPLDGATSYRVLVADNANQEVAASGPLPPAITQWAPPSPLKRGDLYTWVVIATINNAEVTAPAATAPEMKFKLLSDEKAKELARLRQITRSHLALGVFYAREGMLKEAEREFQQLVNDNPNSPIALKLLRTVQSWR